MESLPPINLFSIIHMVVLCLWGGVVAAEMVLELYPYRRRELHNHSILYHFWIDLLIELPLIGCVIATGTVLVAMAWPLSGVHFIKIGCALVAVTANLVCIGIVVKRKKLLDTGADDARLWKSTRQVILCAVTGVPFAALAAGLGFWLGYQRILDLIA